MEKILIGLSGIVFQVSTIDRASSTEKYKSPRAVLLLDECLPNETRVHSTIMHKLAVQLITVWHSVEVEIRSFRDQEERLLI